MKKDNTIRFIRLIPLLILAAILKIPSYGKKIADLPEIRYPFFIDIGHNKLFVADIKSMVHIYELLGNSTYFVRTFGQKGQGPGEFQFIHRLRVNGKEIEIPTHGKYATFSLDGKFLRESRLGIRPFKNGIYKVGENFVVRHLKFNNLTLETKIKLYDRDQNFIKELENKTTDYGNNRLNLVSSHYSLVVSSERVFIVDSDRETLIRSYNHSGNLLYEVILDLNPAKITQELREKVEREVKEDMNEVRWKAFKKKIYYPDSAPGLNYFGISDNMMVARTYRFKGDKAEFVFFDMKGKELKRMYLYDSGRTSNGTPFCFYKGYFYYIKENYDAETWELFSEKIF